MTASAVGLRRTSLAGLAAWTVLLVVTLVNSAGVLVLDIKPEIYLAPARMGSLFLGAWQPSPQLGFPNFNVGLAPVAWLVAGIQALGITPEMSVRVLRLALYTAGAYGMARLYRRLASAKAGSAGALVAAVLYVANPYAVVGASTLAILLPYALLPWQTLCLVRSLEEPRSWRWPAGFALCFAAMSGMNAGVVPLLQLISVPVVVVALRRRYRLSWRGCLRPLLLCATGVGLVSLYWIVPSLYAVSEGQAVLDNSETLTGISGPSSFAEVLRGLGFWPMYGSNQAGPWLPQFASYLREGPVVALSFGVFVLMAFAVALTRGPVRRLALGLVVVSSVVMVGMFPFSSPSPFGRLLRATFDDVTAAGAFRTTNKAGAVLVLGMALLVAFASSSLARRVRTPGGRTVVGMAVAAVLVGGTYPALTGNLYPRSLDIPQYWHTAATAIDAGPSNERVWLVPGEVQSQYRWAAASPDDLALPLFARPSVLRTTLPVASPYAANLLAAVDTQLQEGTLPPGALSAIAQYLGVGDVVVRNDTDWEQYQGARPWTVLGQVGADLGLKLAGSYGDPGQNVLSPIVPPVTLQEAQLPPVQDYQVVDPQPIARAESGQGAVVLAGDGFGFGPMVAAGLLTTHPTVRLAGSLSAAEFAQLLGPDRRLVLTDTNRRTDTVLGRLAGNQGPLLTATDLPGSTRALFQPADQTVLEVDGGAEVTASQVGSLFGTLAEAAPENAFDGDPATSWQFGDFGTAIGQHLDATLDATRYVDSATILQATIGPVRIAKIRVSFGSVSHVMAMPATGALVVPLGVSASHFSVTVLSTTGVGYNRVGIAEIGLSGLRLTSVARMPQTLTSLAGALSDSARAALAATPLDVVLNRVRGTDTPLDDAEASMQRDFSLPDARSYRLYGIVRPGRGLTEADYDALAGLVGPVTASSTSQAYGLPLYRASLAFDGDPNTAWVPSEPVVGQSITVRFPATTIDHVDLTQAPVAGTNQLDGWATKVQVAIDGRTVAVATTAPGVVHIPVPATHGSSLTLTILARDAVGKPVRISEIGIDGVRATFDKSAADRACVTVGTLDGQPLRMHPLAPVLSLDPQVYEACPGSSLNLAAGQHQLRSDGTWVADTLVLRDRTGETVVAPGPLPATDVIAGRGTSLTVHADASSTPWILDSGQSYDPAWQAHAGGVSLGRPIVVDGYAAGWVVPAGKATTISVTYGPQRATDISLLITVLVVLGCLVLLLAPAIRRRATRLQPPEEAVAPTGRRGPSHGRSPGRGRLVVGGLVATLAAWLLGGPWGLLAAVASLLALGLGLSATVLVRAGVLAAVAVPVAWIVGNRDRWGVVSVDLVQLDPWAGRLAAVALVLLVLGAVAEDAGLRRGRSLWKTPDL